MQTIKGKDSTTLAISQNWNEVDGIYFEYDLVKNKFISINQKGLKILGFENISDANCVDIREIISKDDLLQILPYVHEEASNLKPNAHCCFLRVGKTSNKRKKIFVKFNINHVNDSKSIIGIAHILPENIFNASLLSDHGNQNSESTDSKLFELLTKREKEIFDLLCSGNKNMDIADLLSISHHTVKTHRKRIIKKLKAKNSMDLHKFKIYLV